MHSTRYERRGTSPELARWAALMSEDNSREIAFLREKLPQAITEEVTDRQRQVLDLYYREHLNLRQIGQRLGVNQSTVSRTLRRGENNLRRCLRYGAPNLLDADPAPRGKRREKRSKKKKKNGTAEKDAVPFFFSR